MKRILISLAVVILSIGITLPPIFGLLSPAYIGPQLQKLLSQTTGLQLKLTESPKLQFLPHLEVQIANAEIITASGETLGLLPEIRLSPSWKELFTRQIGNHAIWLKDPKFTLIIPAQGNSIFSNRGAAIPAFTIPIRIENGQLEFHDARSDQLWQISQIDGELAGQDGISFMGGINFAGSRFNLTAQVADLKRLILDGSPSDLTFRQGQLHFTFSGLARIHNGFQLIGNAEVETSDLHEFAHAYDIKTPIDAPPLRISASGGFEANPQQFGFRNGNFQIQGKPARGDLFVINKQPERHLSARLGFDVLDLQPFFSLAEVSGLTAEIALAARQLKFANFTGGETLVDTKISDHLLELDVKKMMLGEGQASGNVKIDSRQSQRKMAAQLALRGANAQQGLGFLFGSNVVDGLVDLDLSAVSQGADWQEMLAHLDGSGRLVLKNGHFPDVQLSALISAIGEKVIQGWAPIDGVQTRVDEISADFTLADGVASATNFHLHNDALRLKGNIDLDFLRAYLQMRLEASDTKDERLLPVAILAEGQFANPKFYPDMPGVLADPKRAYQAMKAMSGKAEP